MTRVHAAPGSASKNACDFTREGEHHQRRFWGERESKREELRPFLTTALKVDKETNMGIVGDIKQELRKVNALKINYTTRIGDVSLNKD